MAYKVFWFLQTSKIHIGDNIYYLVPTDIGVFLEVSREGVDQLLKEVEERFIPTQKSSWWYDVLRIEDPDGNDLLVCLENLLERLDVATFDWQLLPNFNGFLSHDIVKTINIILVIFLMTVPCIYNNVPVP